MAIRMQGTWTVSIKSKQAAYDQRYIVEGADSGNGTYQYVNNNEPPPVLVTGSDWTIRVEHDPGSGWLDSDDRITFPTYSNFQNHFDIQTNDTGADSDFNDLILTCSMPASATDFLIYGSVKSYRGPCIINPCFPKYVVIDSYKHLEKALEHPAIRGVIKKYYPEKLRPQPPFPTDPPELFTPLVLPLRDEIPIPAKEELAIQMINLMLEYDGK